jgi:molybdopterin molybdotransferase
VKPVEEHLAQCLAAVSVLPAVGLAPLDALDCVLAEDVVSDVDPPAFDNSSVDGYAVTMPDVAAAGQGRPVTLPVVADVPAGGGEGEPLRLVPGTSVRIMTGAPLASGSPPGRWLCWRRSAVDGSRSVHGRGSSSCRPGAS